MELVPEHTSRALNREFEDKLVFTVCRRMFNRLFLPVPVATAITSSPSITLGRKRAAANATAPHTVCQQDITHDYSQVLPDLLDAVDTDKMADGYAGYLGLETDMLRAQEDRDEMREQRAQQMAQAQQAEQMAAMGPMAQSAKNLSETQIGGEKESALDALLGSFGGV